ncbi:Detected protein of unknown function [Hibiscus syriacus]|uniref:Uncharacterized protein n=1 Tax=Hibiscus syriacus TaxID=106335 RepID=A0A6A2XS78_HIBSY|nr:Detected protein of unknown function [Hibiscus syriacus]
MEESFANDVPQDEVPIAVIHPGADVSASVSARYTSCELATDPDEIPSALEIASSPPGEVQISEGNEMLALDVLKKSPAKDACDVENVEGNGCVCHLDLTPNELRCLHDASDITKGEENVEISWMKDVVLHVLEIVSCPRSLVHVLVKLGEILLILWQRAPLRDKKWMTFQSPQPGGAERCKLQMTGTRPPPPLLLPEALTASARHVPNDASRRSTPAVHARLRGFKSSNSKLRSKTVGLKIYKDKKEIVCQMIMYLTWPVASVSLKRNDLQDLREVDDELLRALVQFWNPGYNCFTFNKEDLVPTIEEYTTLLHIEGALENRIYSKSIKTQPFRVKLAKIAGVREEWVAARTKQKGESEALLGPTLENLFRAIQILKYDSIYLLWVYRRLGGGRFSGCTQLLYVWIRSHFWRTEKEIAPLLVIRQYEGRQFIPVTAGLQSSEFAFHSKNYKRNIMEAVTAWKTTFCIRAKAAKEMLTPDYEEWRSVRKNENIPLPDQNEDISMDDRIKVVPSEIEILRAEFEAERDGWTKELEQMRQDKAMLGVDIDFHSSQCAMLRKDKEKGEDEYRALQKDYQELYKSRKASGPSQSTGFESEMNQLIAELEIRSQKMEESNVEKENGSWKGKISIPDLRITELEQTLEGTTERWQKSTELSKEVKKEAYGVRGHGTMSEVASMLGELAVEAEIIEHQVDPVSKCGKKRIEEHHKEQEEMRMKLEKIEASIANSQDSMMKKIEDMFKRQAISGKMQENPVSFDQEPIPSRFSTESIYHSGTTPIQINARTSALQEVKSHEDQQVDPASSSKNPLISDVKIGDLNTDQLIPDLNELNEKQKVNEELTRQIKSLEERMKSVEITESFYGFDASELSLVPDLILPIKFKAPEFDKYNGTTCPSSHITMFCRRMAGYVKDEKLLIHCFQDSLTGPALKWYTQLTKANIRSWKDLAKAFLEQYRHVTDMVPDRWTLQNLEKKNNETFRQYAQRWRDTAAQVHLCQKKRPQ